MNNKITLIIVVILIVIAIIFLNKTKVQSINITNSTAEIKNNSENINLESSLYPKAIEIVNPSGYLNTDYINIQDNIGKKVILVDFWTYTCINCQRTFPYLNSWWDKYKDKGLLIIGIHTPEFEFEKDHQNVQDAIDKYNIKYPVVQDNDYSTWRAYGNRYWPREYLIDINGFIVHDHIGEGGYEETEQKIQELLDERNTYLKINELIDKNISNPNITNTDFQKIGTPEIYFGYSFSRDQFGNEEGYNPEKVVSYKIPDNIDGNKFYLDGNWLNNNDNMQLNSSSGKIKLKYYAKNVNLVAGSKETVNAKVYLDGKELKNVAIKEFDLYNLVSDLDYNEHTLEIDFDNPGLEAYTFTFG